MAKLICIVRHSRSRTLATVAVISRPSTFRVMVSPTPMAEGLSYVFVNRQQWRTGIISRPPLAGYDFGISPAGLWRKSVRDHRGSSIHVPG